MIEKTSSYKTTDGAVHPTIGAAKLAEIKILMATDIAEDAAITQAQMATWISDHETALVEILKVKARKKREAKKPATATASSKKRGTLVAAPAS